MKNDLQIKGGFPISRTVSSVATDFSKEIDLVNYFFSLYKKLYPVISLLQIERPNPLMVWKIIGLFKNGGILDFEILM